MAEKNTSISTGSQSSEGFRLGVWDAFGIGADAVNRIHAMISAALQIASAPNAEGHTAAFLASYLREVQNLTEDLAGMLEAERDAAEKREAKQ